MLSIDPSECSFERGMEMYYRLNESLAKLKVPSEVGTGLQEMDGMQVTYPVLRATGAMKIIYSFFDHPTYGDLALKVSQHFFFSAPPYVGPPRKTATKRYSPSVSEEQNETIEINSLDIPTKKAKSSEEEKKDEMFTSKKERTRMYSGKTISPPISSNTSTITPSTLPKENNADARLKELTERISRKKADSENRNRKTITISDATSSLHPRRAERIMHTNGRPLIRLIDNSARK